MSIEKDLYNACRQGDKSKVASILQSNPHINVNYVTFTDFTPLQRACFHGHVDIIRLLPSMWINQIILKELHFTLLARKAARMWSNYFFKVIQIWSNLLYWRWFQIVVFCFSLLCKTWPRGQVIWSNLLYWRWSRWSESTNLFWKNSIFLGLWTWSWGSDQIATSR